MMSWPCASTSAACSFAFRPDAASCSIVRSSSAALLQIASAERAERGAASKKHLAAQVAQHAVLAVLQVEQRVDAAKGGIARRCVAPQRRMHRLPMLLEGLAISVRPCASPAKPSSLASARVTMTSRRRSRPCERNSSALARTAAQSAGMVICVGRAVAVVVGRPLICGSSRRSSSWKRGSLRKSSPDGFSPSNGLSQSARSIKC